MRITHSGSRLVISETPIALWALGLLFVATGCFVLSVPVWAPEWAGLGIWERLGVLAIGLGHLAGGLFTSSQPRATRTEIDLAANTGRVTSRRLWDTRGGVQGTFNPSAARAVEMVASSDGDGGTVYRLRLWLSRSEVVWLQGQAVHGERYLRARAERIAAFLSLGPPLVGSESGAPPRAVRESGPVRPGRVGPSGA